MSFVGPFNPAIYDSPTYNVRHLKLAWRAGKAVGKSVKDYINKEGQVTKKRKDTLTEKKPNMPKTKKSGAYSSYESNPVKSLVSRSAAKITGKTKTKRVIKVAVPPRLRKQIKQVLVGQQAMGIYETCKEGYVGALFVADGVFATPIAGDDLGGTQNAVYLNRNTQIPGRTLFNQLVNRQVAPNPSQIIAGAGMNYFTPAKIIDAASVLFNQKAADRNPYITTGNLSTTYNPTSGAPSVTNYGTLKINVLDSYVKFSLKNLSNRVITLEIWECMPTKMFQETNPLADLATTIAGLTTSATNDTAFEYLDAGASGVGQLKPEIAINEVCLDPLEIAKKHFDYKWTWKKRLMIMAPEETCVHTIKGPTGMFDYKKFNTVDATSPTPGLVYVQNSLAKGWSVSCIFAVSGDQVLADNGQGGRKLFLGNGNVVLSCPVAVEVHEVYKLAVPEIAGFVTRAGSAGASQMLNMRKQKHIIFSQKERGNNQYNVSNEVNPLAEGTANAQNQ